MTSLEDALRGVQRLGIDTAPLIYLIEAHPKLGPVALELVRQAAARKIRLVTSTITVTEVLAQPLRLGRAEIAARYRTILLHTADIQVVPVDTVIAEAAAHLRAKHGLRTPDALQIAAAQAMQCEIFVTNDAQLTRVTEIPVVLLSELTT